MPDVRPEIFFGAGRFNQSTTMDLRYKKLFLGVFLPVLFFLGAAVSAQSADAGLTASPQIIDGQAQAKDLLEYEFTVRNDSEQFRQFYIFVSDWDELSGRQDDADPSGLDRSLSLASWMSIKRGVYEMMPKTEIVIPLKINVNLNAKPGRRHAAITFAEGGDRPAAAGNMAAGGQPQALVNLEIVEEIIEKAQIADFKAEKNVWFRAPVNFTLTIKNIGNRPVQPQGFFYIFNRRGQEIEKIPLGFDAPAISPSSVWTYNFSWKNEDVRGRFRGRLEMEYGTASPRDLLDSIFFWVIPVRYLWFAAGALLALLILVIIVFFRLRPRSDWAPDDPIRGHDGVINLKKEK
ncbi:hypothetical protein COX69_02970 [Candidatus Falkowbacteria bacterium CG_4_10_14_0_2_um_filter_48_10]|uniref:DUF916 domain-containing protein n=1 Tax=Candidatus Falkowbacteria bacterium CG23_combo_of_CG06-09_8_20_14_all_49_15 TaxID=1974572 RepID=A0A2G9ZLC0_9BACT|nr:MAG: hypothetical protein COX22_01510 [Candidatus Falkowbacteria bacterium CG23_combo_of_CG06-09_8_20_14_all_49_15]PJA08186.1 MAG: hypothetical protein COX69_02970 [Candidatus Falkowbacteria bacterium CG_4_10_14_0_2_um_filter_48_10]